MRHHPQAGARARSHARGFSLLEALIALLVLSFGMLAIAGFQTTLTRSSDLAKQRSEATRLAQQKMETLRSFGQVATDPTTGALHKFNYTDDVVSSTVPETISANTNATFSRTWTVTANAANTEKAINVQVAWTDRTGQAQNVQLLSVISKFDPQTIGTLATGPGGSNVRRPKNRNVNIPYPSVTLSGGTQSAFIPPPGNVAYVFDNGTGNIVQSCTGLTNTVPTPVTIQTLASSGTLVTVSASGHSFVPGNAVAIAGTGNASFDGTFTVVNATAGSTFTYNLPSVPGTATGSGGTAVLYATLLVEGLNLASSAAVCSTLNAYLLSGYVRFDTSSNPSGEEPGNPGSNNNTLPLNAATPLTLDASNQSTTNGTPTMTCYAQRQKVVTISNPVAMSITGLSLSGSTVQVTAAGHGFVVGQTVAVNSSSSPAFSGAFVITGVPTVNTFTYTLPPPLPQSAPSPGGTVQLVQRLTIQEGASVSGYSNSNPVGRFISYACIVTPVDHDLLAATPARWWGRVTLNTDASWTIGSANGNYRVCRYSADYNGNGAISNSEHPLWYRGVIGALDNQNFLVIDGNESCPTEQPADPFSNQASRYSDDTTALHQPFVSPGVLSFQCPSGGCGSRAILEPSNTATDLLMD